MVALAAAPAVYFAAGMPGMDHSGAATNASVHASHRTLDPASFGAVLNDADVVTLNVHEPPAAVLVGTELTMPFDRIDPARLPTDRDTTIAVYCRSGAMSTIAVERLLELGYTHIVELEGGTDAWPGSGRQPSGGAES